MAVSIRLLQTMVDIWSRRDEPRTSDLQRALHAARVLERDPSCPPFLCAFASRLVVDTHHAVGWEIPAEDSFASCHAAAASLSHSASLLVDEISEQVHGIASPVLLLGALAASRSVFGRWDLLPACGALLVSLDDDDGHGRAEGNDLPEVHGIRWAAPGRLREVYEESASPAALNGSQVLIPHPELIAARSKMRRTRAEDPETLIFCGAAHAASRHGRWSDVNRIAKVLGHRGMPAEIAVSLGIDRMLGLEISRPRRAALCIRRFLRGRAAR